jgi:hypothetical protein
VWSFGGKMVDENNQVVINSPETIKALEYAAELYKTSCGHLVLARPLQQQGVPRRPVSWTINGISVYYAAKNSDDPKIKALAMTSTSGACRSVRRPPTELHLTCPRWSSPTRISECRQGLHPLHAGARAVYALAGGLDRLFQPAAARV